MHDVTDIAFRQVVASCKKPDVLYTEFVSIDGLAHEKSAERLKRYYLQFSSEERPIVAQVWGSDPEKFANAARIAEELGFDGIDINMGCPDKKVVSAGGGAAHMLPENRSNAHACIEAAQSAARVPVSVKTRLGYDEIDLPWIESLMQSGIRALTVHFRTKKELSKVPAHWECAGKLRAMRGNGGPVLIGNGDIRSVREGTEMARMHGIDGCMAGRAVLGNPWFFSGSGKPESLLERLEKMKLHAELFKEYFDGMKSFAMLKKHVRGYVHSFAGAKALRETIMEAKNIDEFLERISGVISEEKKNA